MVTNLAVRNAVFGWLEDQVSLYDDVLPRRLLQEGFVFQNERIRLVGPQGIFKPRILTDAPLSITTSPNGPYNDSFRGHDLLHYRYRGTNPNHHENLGLRTAMRERIPLVYFHGVVPGKYLAVWPAYIVGDDPGSLTFHVALDYKQSIAGLADDRQEADIDDGGANARRRYITSAFRVRLHQRAFRERVLNAYKSQCALCRLRHAELLDAAHIIADADPDGEPIVQNGIALCKLHHAAFDKQFIGVRPDYVVEVRSDILLEDDGPMLLHGLKELHMQGIQLPRHKALRPDPERLAQRYKVFLSNE